MNKMVESVGLYLEGKYSFITKIHTRVQACATDFSLICSDRWHHHRNADGSVHQGSAMEDSSRYCMLHDDDHVIHQNVKASCKFSLAVRFWIYPLL